MRKVVLSLAFAAIVAAAPISDWFFGNTLASGVWTSQASGGTIVQSNGGVTLSAPAGSTHDNFAGTLKISQAAANSDFSVMVKVSTIPPAQTGGYYEVSLGAYGDVNNYVKLKYSSSGLVYTLQIQTAVAGVGAFPQSSARSGDTFPIWLELSRGTNTWDARYSFNGASWTDMGTGTATISVSSISLWTDNWNGTAGSTLAFAETFSGFCNSTSANVCIPPVKTHPVLF